MMLINILHQKEKEVKLSLTSHPGIISKGKKRGIIGILGILILDA